MIVSSPKQLKDWINNLVKRDNLVNNTVLQSFMMERLLESIINTFVKTQNQKFLDKSSFVFCLNHSESEFIKNC